MLPGMLAGIAEAESRQLEPGNWPPSHCEALKEFVTGGMSYRDAASALNARFGTFYSRSAALGRGRRMGLGEPEGPKPPPKGMRFQQPRSDGSELMELLRRRPLFPRREVGKLRCVEVSPRHLDLVELERGDCRYPYGGDLEGQAITFCGRPRRKGSSYCTPHFHLTRNPEVPVGPTTSMAPLRLVATV